MLRTKHAAMEMKVPEGFKIPVPLHKPAVPSHAETAVLSHKPAVPSPKLKTAANVLHEENGLILFKSELPHVVDLFERVGGNKIKQIASFYRQSDEAALAAGKAYMRVRSIKCKEP